MKIPEIQAGWELFANSDGKANVTKWVEALESGKYRQTKNMLHRPSGGYCCLGVWCNLVNPKAWRDPNEDGFKWDTSRIVLTIPQERALGLMEWDGTVENGVDSHGDSLSLASLNDQGATFKQIAKFIRDMWKHQFGEDLTG